MPPVLMWVYLIKPEGEKIKNRAVRIPPQLLEQINDEDIENSGPECCDIIAAKRKKMLDMWKDKVASHYFSELGIDGKGIKNIVAL